jgi:peptide/nickel transport system substrate-binding protein
MAATDELSAPDDQRIVFPAEEAFPTLPRLAGTTNIAFIMPERLASMDP